ncbi:hypothetical protein MMC13_001612, partial [Lambiella insularis]|nr:hypothetical protein [Lambiella insularis]
MSQTPGHSSMDPSGAPNRRGGYTRAQMERARVAVASCISAEISSRFGADVASQVRFKIITGDQVAPQSFMSTSASETASAENDEPLDALEYSTFDDLLKKLAQLSPTTPLPASFVNAGITRLVTDRPVHPTSNGTVWITDDIEVVEIAADKAHFLKLRKSLHLDSKRKD